MASIYDHPETYDLEHSARRADIEFFVGLTQQFRPKRILELACGDGLVTIPVARAAIEWGGEVLGIDSSAEMLERGKQKAGADLVSWIKGDLRSDFAGGDYDFIFSPCSSLSHLVETKDQLAVWRNAFKALQPGGRLVIAEVMPNFALLAESMRIPPRELVELDGSFERNGERLVRRRSADYLADSQRLCVHYFYDRFAGDGTHEAHVYFPNELRLLFFMAGFEIEAEWGDYHRGPFEHSSRAMVVCGVRPREGNGAFS